MQVEDNMTSSIMTHAEARQWIKALGLSYRLCLPAKDRVLFVAQPGGGLWRVRRHKSGGYEVDCPPMA